MTAQHRTMTNAEYHADRTADSWTTIKCFDDNSFDYRDFYVTNMRKPPEPSEPMVKGQMCHTMIANESPWWVIQPEEIEVRRGKDWKAFVEANIGKTIVKADWQRAAAAMKLGVMVNPQARRLIEQATDVENSIFWTHEASGLPVKCRLDVASVDYIADIKCVRDPSEGPFKFQIGPKGLKYYRQASHYCAGFKAVYDVIPTFYFIAVRNEPPWDSRVYELPRVLIKEGAACNRETLERLAKAKAENKFEPPGYDTVTVLDMNYYDYSHYYQGE